MAATMGSETTAAQAGAQGVLRRDPFAMLPFCGYNFGDYFAHWLKIGASTDASKLPKIFYVNWFRKDASGKWLWPGFGENSRVLEWVFQRCDGEGGAVETPIGILPAKGAISTEGIDVSSDDMDELLRVDVVEWRDELPDIKAHFEQFGDRMPKELWAQYEALERRLEG